MFIRALILTILSGFPSLAPANQPTASGSTALSFASEDPSVIELFKAIEEPSQAAARSLVALDNTLNPDVARRAVQAIYCAQDQGMDVDKVIVVDMNIQAAKKRLWAFDIKNPSQPRLVINERVAHGSGSDPNSVGKAEKFSNTENSHMTSLGLYKIAERYQGKNGWSRRLDGLFARFNGRARERAVVMHPSTYVTDNWVGRSQGCPAVSQKTMDLLEKAGLKNAVLWIDGPDKTLAKEVADCSKKRQAVQHAAKAIATQNQGFDFIASVGPDHNSSATTLFPVPLDVERVFGCALTVPRRRVFPCQLDTNGA